MPPLRRKISRAYEVLRNMWKGDGMIRAALCLILAITPAFAAVEGVIVNGTTGQPQANTLVMLIQPTQAGMQTLGTTKTDAQGKFSFDNNDSSGPRLIQA